MLRHRLLDVDLIIRRSLVYGVLWIGIAALYILVAAALGVIAGRRLSVGLAVVVTMVAAVVFEPATRGLERVADRLVFGERLSGYDIIRRLGTTLEHTYDARSLAPLVAATVREGLDAEWARVELPEVDGRSASDANQSGPVHGPAQLDIELAYGGERVGSIQCGPKREGSYSEPDRQLLEALARQSSLAIRNATLASDLAARLDDLEEQSRQLSESRLRIVRAEEAERRRIERDLHDGIQQEIVALMAKLELARVQISDGSAGEAERTLEEMAGIVGQTHKGLRELARGIHPAVLSDRGLVEAIGARASTLPIGVTIDVDQGLNGTRFAPETEGAAYFVVSEALTNVIKHAHAPDATVRVALVDPPGELQIEIVDRGCGFDDSAATRHGLRGLGGRLEALQGSLYVTSRPGAGTTVIARLPARGRHG